MMLGVAVFWKVFAATLFLLTCFLLVVVVLLQKGRGGGLAGAFGGAGGHSAFGAKTGDFFTWLTVGLAGFFLLMAIMNNFLFRKVTVVSPAAAQPMQAPAPGGQAAPESGAGEAPAAAPTPAGQAQPTPVVPVAPAAAPAAPKPPAPLPASQPKK
jgi:preprotein translocase subunit SecG